jgi:Protein of unknown function (DUF3551)
MRILVVLSVVVAGSISCGSAFAYDRPYCMDVAEIGGSRTDCAYDTREQCLASKVDNSSTCYPNPRWVPARRRPQ